MKKRVSLFVFLFFTVCSFAQVTVETNIPASIAPNTDLLIEIKINKGSITNFSKYQIDVPSGMTVTEGDSRTGNFTFEGNRAKVVWVSIPAQPIFVISFKMNTGYSSGPGVFNHKFYYLGDGGKKEVEFDPINVNFDPAGAKSVTSFGFPATPADNNSGATMTIATSDAGNETPTTSSNTANNSSTNTATEPVNTTVKTEEPVKTTPIDNTSTAKTTENTSAKTTENTTTKISPANTNSGSSAGTVYRVQLGAYGATPDKSLFKGLTDKVIVVKEGGFYKAQVGNFSTKEEALSKLNAIKGIGLNGFIAAYQNGVRVK